MVDSTPPRAWTPGSLWGFGSLVELRVGVCVIADPSGRSQGLCP